MGVQIGMSIIALLLPAARGTLVTVLALLILETALLLILPTVEPLTLLTVIALTPKTAAPGPFVELQIGQGFAATPGTLAETATRQIAGTRGVTVLPLTLQVVGLGTVETVILLIQGPAPQTLALSLVGLLAPPGPVFLGSWEAV
jgi:hypothetical protein